MSHLWMPLCPSDYISKTAKLSTAQHGAYLLLTMEYWEHGKLDDNDEQLAQVTRQSLKGWLKMKPIIQSYFYDGWKHKRIDEELSKADDITDKRRAAAKQKHDKQDAKACANGHANEMQVQVHKHTHSHSPNEVNNIIKNGKGNGKYKRLAEHGDQTKDGKLIYLRKSFDGFAEAFQDVIDITGKEPKLDERGGFWAWWLGEAQRDPRYRTKPKFKLLSNAEKETA